MSEEAVSRKDIAKGVLVLLVIAYLAVNLVVWFVEQANPESDTNRKSYDCVQQVEDSGLSWTDVPEYGDAIDDCEAGY